MKNIIKEHCRCQELQERTNDVDIICESCKAGTYGIAKAYFYIDKPNTCDCMAPKYDEPKPELSHDLAKLCPCLEHRAWCCFYTYDKEEHKKHWIKHYKLLGEDME